MTYFVTTLVLFLASIATGILAFGGFQPAPSIALVLFIAFTSLLVMSAAFARRVASSSPHSSAMATSMLQSRLPGR